MARIGEERLETICKCGHAVPVIADAEDDFLFYFECPMCGASVTISTRRVEAE